MFPIRKQQLLSSLRISEEEITSTTEIPDSLLELKFRQGDGKHLFQQTIVLAYLQ
jgi:hypothetical protein